MCIAAKSLVACVAQCVYNTCFQRREIYGDDIYENGIEFVLFISSVNNPPVA